MLSAPKNTRPLPGDCNSICGYTMLGRPCFDLRSCEKLCTVDIIKEKLYAAYHLTDKAKMKHEIQEIADICLYDVDNVHLKKFGRMLLSHMDGIYTHATYAISTGKIEGINNKIKTLRRQGYGYPDDEYFFLKLIDMSRVTYVRNPKSHRKSD